MKKSIAAKPAPALSPAAWAGIQDFGVLILVLVPIGVHAISNPKALRSSSAHGMYFDLLAGLSFSAGALKRLDVVDLVFDRELVEP